MKNTINLILALLLVSACNGQSEQDKLKEELKGIITTYAETAYRGEDLTKNEFLKKYFDQKYLEVCNRIHQRATDFNTPEYTLNITNEFFSTKEIKERGGSAAVYAAKIEYKGYYIEVALIKSPEGKVEFLEDFVSRINYYPTDPKAEKQTEEYVGKAWDDLVLEIKKLNFK